MNILKFSSDKIYTEKITLILLRMFPVLNLLIFFINFFYSTSSFSSQNFNIKLITVMIPILFPY